MSKAATLARALRTAPAGEVKALGEAIVGLGPAAIEALVAELQTEELGRAGILEDLIEAQRHPEAVPALLAALEKEGPHERSVLRALGWHADRRAGEALMEYVAQSPAYKHVQRQVAIEALGRMGDPRGMEFLSGKASRLLREEGEAELALMCQEAEDAHEMGPLVTLLTTAVALGRLGSMDLAWVPVRLLSRASIHEDYDAIVRERAAAALTHVAGPQVQEALHKAVRDDNVEVRRHAVRGLYLWGTPSEVPGLLSALDDDDHETRHNAGIYLSWMLDPEADPHASLSAESWRELWRALEPQVRPGVPMRGGAPLDIGHLIESLERRGRDGVWELTRLTNADFSPLPYVPTEAQPRPQQRARLWWEHNAERFAPGLLYRYGRVVRWD